MATTTLLLHPLQDWLPDGTEIRRVPDMKRTGNRPLYTTFDGAPYSHILQRDHVHGGYKSIYRLQVPTVDTCPCNRFNGNRVQRYFKMVHFGGIYLAHAVALAWIGEQQTDEDGRPFQCHHLNGVTFDNRASNLIWLSRADHRRYDAIQRALRVCGRLDSMTPHEILAETQKQLRLLTLKEPDCGAEPDKYC